LERRGELGAADREHIQRVARVRAGVWRRLPEVVIADFLARTLELPQLATAHVRWTEELDGRGPWLRPLRPIATREEVVAELCESDELAPTTFCTPRFVGEDEVLLEARPYPAATSPRVRWRWRWRDGAVLREDAEPPVLPPAYPRFEPGDVAPLLRRRAADEALALPWPAFGRADAQLSADGRRIFVYGWYEDYDGLLQVLDAETLEIQRSLEFGSPVLAVLEHPGSEELAVATGSAVTLVDRQPRWTASEGARHAAWSASGRYLCLVQGGMARIWDSHCAQPAQRLDESGFPPCFDPEGARLLDGRGLFDGHSGARLATLAARFGDYLEGGPPAP
ncbi:MAG: hypothetical protein KC431_25645, partial [Myxococcales bacterium]|nr:hypothetical protein [Myxococcales bacterium]